MRPLLPDTNVLSELFRNNARVRTRLREAQQLLISPVVEGELLGGFRAGNRLAKNLTVWKAFMAQPYVERLILSGECADRYGRIWAELRRNGTPIPANDLWIAAQAMEAGVELLSFDGHFECVPGLVWTRLAA